LDRDGLRRPENTMERQSASRSGPFAVGAASHRYNDACPNLAQRMCRSPRRMSVVKENSGHVVKKRHAQPYRAAHSRRARAEALRHCRVRDYRIAQASVRPCPPTLRSGHAMTSPPRADHGETENAVAARLDQRLHEAARLDIVSDRNTARLAASSTRTAMPWRWASPSLSQRARAAGR